MPKKGNSVFLEEFTEYLKSENIVAKFGFYSQEGDNCLLFWSKFLKLLISIDIIEKLFPVDISTSSLLISQTII